MTMRWLAAVLLSSLLVVTAGVETACAAGDKTDTATPKNDKAAPAKTKADTPDKSKDKDASKSDADKQPLPHIFIDRKNKRVDIEAQVVLREGEWLELLACLPGSKEHESILATKTKKASHIHLALLAIGVRAGSPMRWVERDDKYVTIPAKGPEIAVTLIYTPKDKKQPVEVKANEWIIDQKTNKKLEDNIWMFVGSSFYKNEGSDEEHYAADTNGTVVSLVNFGDELLAKSTKLTHRTDERTWGTLTKAIPPVGTAVTIRLTPVEKKDKKDDGKKDDAKKDDAKKHDGKDGKKQDDKKSDSKPKT